MLYQPPYPTPGCWQVTQPIIYRTVDLYDCLSPWRQQSVDYIFFRASAEIILLCYGGTKVPMDDAERNVAVCQ